MLFIISCLPHRRKRFLQCVLYKEQLSEYFICNNSSIKSTTSTLSFTDLLNDFQCRSLFTSTLSSSGDKMRFRVKNGRDMSRGLSLPESRLGRVRSVRRLVLFPKFPTVPGRESLSSVHQSS